MVVDVSGGLRQLPFSHGDIASMAEIKDGDLLFPSHSTLTMT
jgi:hypothetical protein